VDDAQSAIAVAKRTCAPAAEVIRARGGGPGDWRADRRGGSWHVYLPGSYVSVEVPDRFRGRSLDFKAACSYIVEQ